MMLARVVSLARCNVPVSQNIMSLSLLGTSYDILVSRSTLERPFATSLRQTSRWKGPSGSLSVLDRCYFYTLSGMS